ncbi:hypothetical protein ANN_02236 [Periplaneta americana]|uniref:Reverse transcriptase n=1 Tax=Periplaneta americana TaxID=6978 RepID=A0ABQ8TVQ7_PERAM|nr:hypothetical protein ANN_02236 [Periplaneta americana]
MGAYIRGLVFLIGGILFAKGILIEDVLAFAFIIQSALKKAEVKIYKTVILPVVLYGCQTLTLTLREEQRLRVFENEVLRKIFGAKRDEVTGEWRKLHNAELHALYSSPDIIRNIKSRRLRWAGHVARMGEFINTYSMLVGRPEGKIPLERPRRRWEDNIEMDLREVEYDGRDWINLAQGGLIEWRDDIKMVGNVAAVRAVPGRSQDNRCRHCQNEVETLAHVLGSCPHDVGLRNARHHQVRSIIATALKDAHYNTFEEVHGLSVTGSTRRIDIIAFKESTRSGFIIDPTVRFETNGEQPAEVNKEKRISTIIPFHITSKSTS